MELPQKELKTTERNLVSNRKPLTNQNPYAGNGKAEMEQLAET
jgi:hypothetical protein